MVIDGPQGPEQNPAYRPSAHISPPDFPPEDGPDSANPALGALIPRAMLPARATGPESRKIRTKTWAKRRINTLT
jgi:hypothetical protein